jgi:Tfp pilus assembly protein PilF
MRSLIVIALLSGGVTAAGCASRTSAPLSAKLVPPGKPAVHADADSLPAELLRRQQKKQLRQLSVKPVMKASTGSSAELTDPKLASALKLWRASPSAANSLGIAEQYHRLGILDTAHAHASRAVAQEPRLAQAHELLARIWREWGLPGLGLGSAWRATYFDPTSAPAENTLGMLLDATGQPAEAWRAFARAAALGANAGWALNNLCFVELRMERLIDARSHCEAALDADPNMIAAHNNLALIFVAEGDAAAARLAFLAAGDSAGAAYNRGIVHLTHREYARAADAFEEAIAARPAFTAAKTRAHEARMLALTGSHD